VFKYVQLSNYYFISCPFLPEHMYTYIYLLISKMFIAKSIKISYI